MESCVTNVRHYYHGKTILVPGFDINALEKKRKNHSLIVYNDEDFKVIHLYPWKGLLSGTESIIYKLLTIM